MSNLKSQESIKTFDTLLELFKALPKEKHNKTLMEVAGYSHYENIASNILAFFFDPAEEHGLEDMLLTAFIKVYDENLVLDFDNIEVHREVVTATQKRIDLTVSGDDFTICIENKIFHWLANDLEDYSSEMERIGRGKSTLCKVVLGLHPISNQEQLKGGFINCTYSQLWEQVQSMIEGYSSNAPSKWLTFLNDFMDTTKNLAGQKMEQRKNDQFLIDNNDAIEALLIMRNHFLKRLGQKASNLFRSLGKLSIVNLHCEKLWMAHKKLIVLDIKLHENHRTAFDLFISPKGWKLLLFVRDPPSRIYLEELLKKPRAERPPLQSKNIQKEGFKHRVKTWPLEASPDDLIEDIQQFLVALAETANAS